MSQKRVKKICCFCGIREANTKDHIPPKAIFTKPRPGDLITVPSCRECNNNASGTDEAFKAYLGMHVAKQSSEAERLFKEGVIPTARNNNRLKRQILETSYPIFIASDSGIVNAHKAVPWDNAAHDLTIERITKGLFFHHYGKIITSDTTIQTYWFKEPPDFPGMELYANSVGNGAFTYHYNKVDEADFDSMWFFDFYGGHFAGSIVSSSDKNIEI